MRVFCINDTGWEESKRFLFLSWTKTTDGPTYGDVCTVTGETYGNGRKYYQIMEWDNEEYMAECFIPLSEIDEMELVKERELVNQ